MASAGPLQGIRVVEMAGLGPGPFCCMLLADMGAEVIRVDRIGGSVGPTVGRATDTVVNRGRRSVAIDVKHARGRELVVRLADTADVFIDVFRPGVAERLGIGPDVLCPRNPALVYGRMTGWGQDGPRASAVGHDINYLAVAGALGAIGRKGQPPAVPLSLIGDFGGGAMMLAVGVLAALLERASSGLGQTIDAAMVDGAALLMAPFFALHQTGGWSNARGENFLDSGAPYYDAYKTLDGRWLAVGAMEPEFYAQFLHGLGLDDVPLAEQDDRDAWPQLKQVFASRIAEHHLEDWLARFESLNACVSGVNTLGEALEDEHLNARSSFVTVDGVKQPAPCPRFERTPGAVGAPGPCAGAHTEEVLEGAGLSAAEIEELVFNGVVGVVR